MYYNEKHENIVNSRSDGYEYIGTYPFGEITLDSKKSVSDMIRIKCPYCGNEYDIRISGFKRGDKCNHCCNEYERSLAYHIQVNLQEPLNKYWDWDKNTINPYLIPRRSDRKVWIKCAKTDYHNSYEVSCGHFYEGNRCPYCSNQKIHPRDSFAQYHIDNTDEDFLEKYWSEKNTLNPWEIAPRFNKKVFIKCQQIEYHDTYAITCDNFTSGHRCSYCGNHKTHPKDSFGFLHPDKAKYWSPRNKKSPFEVRPHTRISYWFICENCGEEFKKTLSSLNRRNVGVFCDECKMSQGEYKISTWLKDNNFNLSVDYVYDKPYFNDLLSPKGNPLRPDFILPKYKIWIEYDGEFHYKNIDEDGSYYDMVINDNIKNDYAKLHDWKLIRIPYWEFDNIEEILQNTFKEIDYDN